VRALDPVERRLAVEAVLALGAAAFVVAVFSFRRIAEAATRGSAGFAGSDPDRARQVARVRWAVGACARRVPWRAKCFEQGIAAQWMLRRRGVPSILHYGVARGKDELTAHVWLTSGALEVVGCENKGDFAELARFPDEAPGRRRPEAG
jgi:hypothetical protein